MLYLGRVKLKRKDELKDIHIIESIWIRNLTLVRESKELYVNRAYRYNIELGETNNSAIKQIDVRGHGNGEQGQMDDQLQRI